MTQMITAKDLARLHLDLEVPTLLSVIMEKHATLCVEDEQILRRALAQLNSLETLISVACCFQVFTPYLKEDATVLEPLLTHADFILDDYAPYLMKDAFPVGEEWETFLHNDLDSLSEFLCILSDASHGLHPAMPEICDLLNEQAFSRSLHIVMPEAAIYGGNIIRFPVERRI